MVLDLKFTSRKYVSHVYSAQRAVDILRIRVHAAHGILYRDLTACVSAFTCL